MSNGGVDSRTQRTAHFNGHSSPHERRDVFLLGAGFSRAVSEHMPLLPDLARGVLERYPRREHVAPEVVALMEENFAHALSYLEHPKPWLSDAENLRHRGLFLEFSSVIAELLDEAVRRTLDMRKGSAPAWLHRLIRHWHHHRCGVITLNHDTLIETVASGVELEGEPLWAHHLYPPLLTDARLRAGNWQPFLQLDTFVLLKLHGSTNWYYSGRASAYGEPIYFVTPPRPTEGDPQQLNRRLSAVADKYPFLVPPIYDQSNLLTHETIRAHWIQAGQLLQRARRLVCMGYSLPPSDVIMHHFLRTTLPEGVMVEVVDESEKIVANYRQSLEPRSKVSGEFAGQDAIERFVDSTAAKITPE
jgi:hypothetical protein